VLDAANRLRVAGHTVIAPDLYAGQLAATVDEGFALCDQIGWPVILGRARQALAGMPAETVLAGLSMGAAVAAGHLFTDPATPDHDGRAAALAWQRSLSFLADL
jgi:dienelactone hydrolase